MSGKIHISTQSIGASIFDEPKQVGRFALMRAAPNQDDQTRVLSLLPGELKKVVPITGHQH